MVSTQKDCCLLAVMGSVNSVNSVPVTEGENSDHKIGEIIATPVLHRTNRCERGSAHSARTSSTSATTE